MSMGELGKAQLRRILVGVDLSQGDLLVSEELSPPSRGALTRGKQLAAQNQAELHLLFALDVGPRTQQLIQMTRGLADNVLDKSRQVLEMLAAEAREEGVPTRTTVVFGRSWQEMIRQASRNRDDLVVVGTRHLGRLHGALVGSTGMRLVRKCPCPVWIDQPHRGSALDQILVATDFSPACDLALDLAASIASANQARLQLLHVLDLPGEAELRELLHEPDEFHHHRNRFEGDAEKELDLRIERLAASQLRCRAEAVLMKGVPSDTIQAQAEKLNSDLLVMGTMARSGIPGLIIGNTAERLLCQVDCSILAVKPPDFESPVRLSDDAA